MRTRVAVVYNEPSPSRYDTTGERKAVEGVLDAVKAVDRALLELGHEVTRVLLHAPVERIYADLKRLDTDLVFNLFEGLCGQPETEAAVPETLEALGIPFTGCPGRALRLALDKAKSKATLEAAGIPTPRFQSLTPANLDSFRLEFPCIVKPRNEDASHGVTEDSIINDPGSLLEQVKFVTERYGGEALVEEFLEGRELNTTVMGNSACIVLPPSEIEYALPEGLPRILTFAAKWEPDSLYFQGTRVICPAPISAPERERITATALAAYCPLGCRGYARIDMRMDGKGVLNVIEVNPNPDISPDSGAVKQAAAAGVAYTGFINRIVQLALGHEFSSKEVDHVLEQIQR